ncbi:SusC/RagA family TonB-linked outer membrane protein [Flexithrix dorotheae]|uniref:SusC/RagA family TonB-linked outer membrane protein n=1 Tax=Flexithrix dorotheae TaxID=70993 RepID=UPI000378A345|nr:TonB-dependent receptor [Flexithrix dorotheae]
MTKLLLGKTLLLTGLILLMGQIAWSQDMIAKRSSLPEATTNKVTPVQSLIKGTVTSKADGDPLPGVSIVIKGTVQGTTTDLDGKYSLSAPEDATLQFSYIGFEVYEAQVLNQSVIDVAMVPDLEELEEVIIVGYTSQKKSEVTASVATIDADELTDVTSPNVSNLLQGKAAGVQVIQGSGQPGSSPSIRIRGITSMNGSVSPLWVVDGVIVHGVPNINPNEIASISVLKDASATALYGSRGANGVIVVTSKQAEEGKSSLTISSRIGSANFNNGNFKVMNSQQLYDYYLQFGNQDNIPDWFSEDVLANDFDWFANGTQTGLTQDHSLAFTAGTDKSKTYISLGYYDEKGTVKGYDYNRLSFRLNHDYQVNDKLVLKPKVNVNYTKNYNQQHSLYSMYTYLPWDNPYTADGEVINPKASGVDWYGRDESNYLYDLQWNYSKGQSYNMFSNFDFEYEILPNLRFISTNGVTLYYSDGMSYTDPKSISGEANNGQLYKSFAKRITTFTNQMVKYSKVFGSHSLNALVAYEYNDYKYESTGATGYGIVSGTEILDNTATPGNVSGTTNDYALQSLLFNFEYAFDDRYLAQFSIRRDGASNFGKNNQYGTFYSASAGWNIHNESFFDVDQIDQLKLRASYGAVGNRPSSLYPQYDLYSLSTTYDGFPATTPSQLGNDDLAWEKSYQTNIGLDTRIFNKVGLTLEYYNKNTSDLLYYVSLPSTSGYSGYWENIGGVQNKGFEALVSYDIFTGDQNTFSWTVSGNIGVNKNEVTELFEGQDIDRGVKVSQVGEDFNSWFMRKWLGVDPETGDPLWEVVDETTGETSVTTDYNAATKQIVGTASPDFYGGFSSSMSYKGISLSANFAFTKGGKIYNSSRELYDSDGAYPTYNQQELADGWSRWQEPGDVATHPRALFGGNNLSNKTSSRYLEDGSYLRLRNVRLGYAFPQNLIGNAGIRNLELYVSGDNLLTFTGYSGMDPEVGVNSSYGQGYSSSLYPVAKRLSLGLNLTF